MNGASATLDALQRLDPLSGGPTPWRPRAPLQYLVLVDEADPTKGLACVRMNEVRGPHPVLKAAAEHARSESRKVHVRAVCAEDAALLMRQAMRPLLS